MSSQKSNPLPRSQGYTVGTGLPVNYLQEHHHHHHHHHHHLPEQQKNSVAWSSDIFHCCDDPCSCCTTLFCPCVTFGRIAVFANEGSSSCVAKGALYCLAATLTGCFLGGACCCGCCNRRRLKTQFRWQQNACDDCYVHCCCHCCALCQEYRHLQSLGYDPSKGREGNRQIHSGSMIPPPMPRNMSPHS
ncbi:cell number regulator 2 [Eucalyptus grandis]|uniref:cell number regulator 2 n=1 Tax=Eucalyptus grandis TaxID=71139 RepID=UPI000524FF28|nr:cell number regulator 2 [Eucalyptus grandis]